MLQMDQLPHFYPSQCRSAPLSRTMTALPLAFATLRNVATSSDLISPWRPIRSKSRPAFLPISAPRAASIDGKKSKTIQIARIAWCKGISTPLVTRSTLRITDFRCGVAHYGPGGRPGSSHAVATRKNHAGAHDRAIPRRALCRVPARHIGGDESGRRDHASLAFCHLEHKSFHRDY